MLTIAKNGTILLTRGDSAEFAITIRNTKGGNYILKDDDTLRLTVKKSINDSNFVLQKVLVGSDTFKLSPADTKGLNFATYIYDVELTTADGDVYTVIPQSKFTLLPEVTT